jgi:signal transduction histidine kinase
VEELERLMAELELEREARARLAVEAERSRIAREMHDVLSHSVSTMTLQAGAGERLAASDPERAAETFRAIHRSGGQALDELRRMLGLLRVDRELGPQPGVDDLDELMDGARAAGLEASLHAEALPPELPPGLELTIYRIVQEAVTNALKHAGATTLRVALAAAEGAVLVTVEDDGSGEGDLSEAGGAYGLVGMRERVAVYGGDLDAGPRPAGGFAVRARLPVGDPAGSR